MHIVIHEKERSTLAAFAEKHGLTMEIHERTVSDMGARWAADSRYYAHFKGCEIKDGSVLIGAHGNGATPEIAMAEYAQEISERRLVLNAGTTERVELGRAPILTHNTN